MVFIVMPLPPRQVRLSYDEPAWASYQQHIRQLLALPLSPQGAEEFSRRLAGALLLRRLEFLQYATKTIRVRSDRGEFLSARPVV
jgi:hypothetical protein